jgi:peptidoglycan/LPS O-acetylase OafA/YrhL
VRPNYIPTLDGWRAVAIGIVVIGHAFHKSWAVVGVEIFFAISGYLICTNMLVEQEITGEISLVRFYRRRIFRLMPAALVYLSVLTLLMFCGLANTKLIDIFSCVCLWANYNFQRGWEIRHFWSLSMEEHFYLLWPLSLALLGNKRARYFAVIVIAAVCLWRMSANLTDDGILARTDMRLDVFLIPCFAAILLRNARWRERARMIPWPLVASLMIALGLIKLFKPTGPALSLSLMFQACAFSGLVLYTVIHSDEPLGRVLEWPWMRWIGRISYSIYLWQQICVRPSWVTAHISFVPARIALALVLASLSYYVIEQPMIRVGRKLENLNSASRFRHEQLAAPQPFSKAA